MMEVIEDTIIIIIIILSVAEADLTLKGHKRKKATELARKKRDIINNPREMIAVQPIVKTVKGNLI